MKKKQLLTAGLILCLALFSACGISKPADIAPEIKTETGTGIIHLSNQGTTSDCAGVEIAGSRVTITEAGEYELTGTLDAGQLIVDCSGKVTLTLCGISITNPEDAAIDVLNAKKVTLQLAEGSENVLVSGVSEPAVSTEETTGAVIHSKEDLVISGNGSLTVTGYLNNGISSSDELTIKGGSIFVTAANHGLKGKDGVNISGGSIDIRASADGIHSDSQVSVSDGSISISVQDDGIHADDSLNITGGNIVISDSYEGLEANHITISGGNISVAATDDGLNACGGASSFGKEESGKTTEFPVLLISGGQLYVNAGGDGIDSNGDIQIEGGIVVVDGPTNNRNGALDSGTENGGRLLCNGGTVLAIGASGMAECFNQSSSQSFLELVLSDSVPKGTGLEISDSDGNILFSHTAAKKFNSVVFSCAKLKADETYTITISNQSHEVIAGVSSGGGSFWGMGGGPKGPGGPGSRP